MSTTQCNAPLKSCMGLCERYGDAMYGGRCWQHRAVTDADRQAARNERVAKHDAEERWYAARTVERGARSDFETARDELIADLIEGYESTSTQTFELSTLRERVKRLAELRNAWNRAFAAVDALVPE